MYNLFSLAKICSCGVHLFSNQPCKPNRMEALFIFSTSLWTFPSTIWSSITLTRPNCLSQHNTTSKTYEIWNNYCHLGIPQTLGNFSFARMGETVLSPKICKEFFFLLLSLTYLRHRYLQTTSSYSYSAMG